MKENGDGGSEEIPVLLDLGRSALEDGLYVMSRSLGAQLQSKGRSQDSRSRGRSAKRGFFLALRSTMLLRGPKFSLEL